MNTTRRTLLKWLAASVPVSFLPKSWATRHDDIRHILPMATDSSLSISVSVERPKSSLFLSVGDIRIPGNKMDSKGRYWSFTAKDLNPSTSYNLQLSDEDGGIGEPWPLRTFPDRYSEPDSLKLLAFTCAGGGDGFGTPSIQVFKPHTFRQKLFEAALLEQPDAAIAIGDHIYFDLRGDEHPSFGRNSKWMKLFSGLYLSLLYGSFDRSKAIIGTPNEEVLTNIGDEQIADLYGTRFKSTPIYFVSDDHDYFENDDATEDLVTFPPDDFSRAAHKAIADLYYPPLPDSPKPEWNRNFGTFTYGRLFEATLIDCAGKLSLGKDARLFPEAAEDWALTRINSSQAKHYALVPSHPMGWTAGKWREWYPDVVAPEGFTGIVSNELMSGAKRQLSAKAEKYLWQKGWWEQHQRLLEALGKRRHGSRFTFSGDIHAQGAISITQSGEMVFDEPVKSVLVGPVSTSDATWPSAARGVPAAQPAWLSSNELLGTNEVNGFTLFEFTNSEVRPRLFNCGGFDRSRNEDGRIQSTDEILI
ncbi:MAG: phosphodiesterase [Gammaproteobacteria bacterium]|jgi:hypothetical protein|nr:phosphodiesterase [Gammaproteobacteria bacterium]MBT3870532.1 phosphodiesterase [Gammaproteobacteria bacterium]MBT4381626.1 phosphodiesterase [Gammaproteobacteria bacterium]MBT4619139.1 phosphodiesterase [Gammaproteobacteria bacterium]MBT5197142.1 phosphodiesterase [Gammaproteobacteria bacterium]